VPTADLASDRPELVRGLNNANPPGVAGSAGDSEGLDADASHRADAPVRRSATRDWNAVQSPAVRAWEREHTLDAQDGKEVSSWSLEPNPFFDRD
jgi:hypothetical protein